MHTGTIEGPALLIILGYVPGSERQEINVFGMKVLGHVPGYLYPGRRKLDVFGMKVLGVKAGLQLLWN